MKKMPKLILIIISIFYFQQGFGQNSNCRNVDSTLCYANAVYPKGFPIDMEKKWEYSAEISTMNSPLVADLDGDCIPEIIVANNIIDGNPPGLIKDILVLNSMNGSLKYKITTPYYNYASASIVVGNIVGDEKLEILLATSEYNNIDYERAKIICYDYTGTQIWISNRRYGENINSIWKLGGTLALADFNKDGKSEVYIFNEIFSGQTGRKLINGGNNGLGIGHVSDIAISITIASQLDGNANDLELAAGFTIYKIILNNLNDITGNLSIPINLIYNNNKLDGFTSIADINNDNLLDVIVTKAIFNTSNNIYIYCVKNDTAQLITFNENVVDNVLGPSSVFNNKLSKPQIIITSLNKVLSLSFNNTNSLKINWEHEIIDESGIIYSTIFDLNNDDAEEIILRDHNSLRILSLINESPVEIVNFKCGSGTGIEGPIIADLDNSGESKICIPCSPEMWGNNGRLTVFGSPDTLPGWTPARGIWNQYNYHVLNINDDGTVPQYMHNNATYKNGKYNNFMVQESLLDSLGRYPQKATSLTGKINCVNYNTTTKQYEVNFDLNNRTDASLYAKNNLPVSFYNGNPESGGKLIGKYYTTDTIFSGGNLSNLTYSFSGDSITHLFLVVNTERDSTGNFKDHHFLQLECDYTDNFYQFVLTPINKATATICSGESYNFYDDILSTAGIYHHVVKNSKGCDSLVTELVLTIDENCGKCFDSTLCYANAVYPKNFPFGIEKKWEFNDTLNISSPLLCDINGDCIPELVTTGSEYLISSSQNVPNSVIFIDTKSKKIINKINTPFILGGHGWILGIALADLDSDGEIEIVVATSYFENVPSLRQRLICYELDGTLKWISNERYNLNELYFGGSVPHFADFNQDGIPEVYVNNVIFNAQTGIKLLDGGNNGMGIGERINNASYPLPIAAQLDENPNDLELAAGYTVYKINIKNTEGVLGNTITPYNLEIEGRLLEGYTSVADLNNDGKLEIIVSARTIGDCVDKKNRAIFYVYNFLGNEVKLLSYKIIYTPQCDEYDSSPIIASDIENNGIISLTFQLKDSIHNYKLISNNLEKNWSYFTTSYTLDFDYISAFDFNNDGKMEIIYQTLSAINVLSINNSIPTKISSLTCEFAGDFKPIIGKMFDNNNSYFCIPCLGGIIPTSSTSGINFMKLNIFGSPDTLPGWVPARGIWNQSNYHVLNINDDGTVPQYMHNNASYKNGKYNNFFVQESLLDSLGKYPQKATSLTGKINCVNYNTTTNQYEENFDLNNKVDASLYAKNNLPVSFYNGNPETGGKLIGKYYTTDTIFSGSNLNNLNYSFSEDSITHLFLVVNTERDSSGSFKDHQFLQLECDYTDNIYQFVLPPINKTTATICNGESYNFYDHTLSSDGTYHHVLKNNEGCDSLVSELVLTIDENCGKCFDSTLCYVNAVYPKNFPFGIEKKWESDDIVTSDAGLLIADIDGDCIPEIITAGKTNKNDDPTITNKIIIFNSSDGKVKKIVNTAFFSYISPNSFVIGDIDNDGINDLIVAAAFDIKNPINLRGKLICYSFDGNIKWVSNEEFGSNVVYKYGGALNLADFNKDGIAEVYIYNEIFNAQTGIKLIDGGNFGCGISKELFSANGSISSTIAAQLDMDDSDLELAAGYSVYKIQISNLNGMLGNNAIATNIQINNDFKDGFTSIGDINKDNILDITVMSAINNNIPVLYTFGYSKTKQIFELISMYEFTSNNNLISFGSPIIFDVLNNDTSNVIVTFQNKMNCLKYNNTKTYELLWSLDTNDDSGLAGATFFDLNNDRKNEMIYRDEKYLKIYDCSEIPPIEINALKCTSRTSFEVPLITDINNSGFSNICTICGIENLDYNGRLTVFGSPDTLPGWTPARGIWNQYNYHVLNINDDGTIPQYMHNNATYKNGKYNNFFVQESLLDSLGRYPQKATSLTGKINCVNYNTTTNQYEVNFDVNNKVDASLYAKNNLPVSFYNDNPEAGGKLIGNYYTTDTIFSGSNLSNLTFSFSDDSITNLFLVVNTERDSLGSFKDHHFLQLECDYTDNFYQFVLPPINKTTATICNGESYNFYFDTLSTEGIYYHVIQNINGCDSVIVELDLSIEDTISIITNLSTCDTYIWNGNIYTQSGTYIDSKTTAAGCDSIATLNLTINKSSNLTMTANTCDTFSWLGTIYDETGIYTFASQTVAGCDSIMKLELTVIPPDSTMLPTQEICRGDSLLFLGTWYKDGTNATIKLRNQYQCDSFITFELRVIDTLKTIESLSICQGDSVRIFDEWQSEEGSYQKAFQSVKGCDSLAQVQLIVNRVIVNSDSLKICSGDSVFLFNEWQKVAGIYTKKYQSINGCDSTEQVDLIIEPLMVKSDSILICEGDSIIINGKSYSDEGSYQTILSSTIGCDTIFNFHLKHSPLLIKTENYTICEGDSVFINGNWLVPKLVDGQAQVYVYEVREDNCKTEVTANFTINYSQITNNKYILCPEDSILLNNTWVNSTTELTYTLQSSEGCDSVIQAKVTKLKWPEPPVVELDCEDNVYNVSIIADENWDVLWSDMTNGLTTVLKESPAWVKVSTDENCEKIFDINIESLPDLSQLPSFDDQKILEGNDINVKVDLPETEWEVLWLPESAVSCDTCFETTINVATNTTITLELKHLNGCTYVRSFYVIVEKEIISIVIPNIINPTSTSENNIWTVEFPDGYIVQEAKVYDRWGNVVYNNDGSNLISWDGKIDGCEVVPGVYVYLIRLINPDGKTEVLKGDVTVIR